MFIALQRIKFSYLKYCRRAAILHETVISKSIWLSWEINSNEKDFFSPSTSEFLCQYHSIHSSFIYHWRYGVSTIDTFVKQNTLLSRSFSLSLSLSVSVSHSLSELVTKVPLNSGCYTYITRVYRENYYINLTGQCSCQRVS